MIVLAIYDDCFCSCSRYFDPATSRPRVLNPLDEIALYVTAVQDVRQVSNISHRSSHAADALVEHSPLQYLTPLGIKAAQECKQTKA